ncbi:lipase family protein [Gordonia sp. PKS22-38]|uniref:Lipase family protein n=1 Tax=Gordonia prachuapensis TaxID=3115651 RepID=A0ABU7MYP7_9ACTN|nr:lipase family protein [Gordonia sp. PKS22-38]
MLITTAEAPALTELRPVQPIDTSESAQVRSTFPVYPDLTSVLADRRDRAVIAHTLSVAAGYVYSDVETESTMMARMGLTDNLCVAATMSVDAMFIDTTAYIIQSADGRVVILSYRGTELTNPISWVADADVNTDPIAFQFGRDVADPSERYPIHGGFYRNVRRTRYVVIEALKRAAQGLAIHSSGASGDSATRRLAHRMESLYVTGHSFGGAQADLLAVMLMTDDRYHKRFGKQFKGLYTFGQPMVGSPEFAAQCDRLPILAHNTFRYKYRHDPVPHLPPRVTGEFAHHGQEFHLSKSGDDRIRVACRNTGQELFPSRLLWAPIGFVTRQIPLLAGIPLPYNIDDHFPHRYIAALTPPGRANEFGDAEFYRGDD